MCPRRSAPRSMSSENSIEPSALHNDDYDSSSGDDALYGGLSWGFSNDNQQL